MKVPFKSQTGSILGVICAVACLVAGGSWFLQAADEKKAEEPDQSLSAFMRKKLDASSLVLEGLTIEDSQLIKKGANLLLEMSKAEKWKLLIDSEFRSHDIDFRTAVKKLVDAAEKSNFDNATLQWFDVTKGCIECHKDVRSAGKKGK